MTQNAAAGTLPIAKYNDARQSNTTSKSTPLIPNAYQVQKQLPISWSEKREIAKFLKPDIFAITGNK